MAKERKIIHIFKLIKAKWQKTQKQTQDEKTELKIAKSNMAKDTNTKARWKKKCER